MTLPDLEQRFRLLLIIWIALMAGVGLFAGAVYFLLTSGVIKMEAPAIASFLPAGGAVAAGGMALGLLLGRRLEARIEADTPAERFQQYQVVRIVSLGLIEGMGLFVVTLSFVSGAAEWALATGGVTIWVMFLARPRRDDVDRLLR